MKDSERARKFLGGLYVRQEGGHPLEPDHFVDAAQDGEEVGLLMDLLAEVRKDEREQAGAPHTADTAQPPGGTA